MAVSAGGALVEVGRALRLGFFMFWQTLWPLVLGFGLSGAVQAFVPRRQLERALGDHGPAAVARASGLGMVSSSCSYAASAMARALFRKGADFVTAMVFMFASTNLVVELGIVLAVLMGWQFTAAEFAGGAVMVVLLATLGGLVLRPSLVAAARRRAMAGEGEGHGHAAAPAVDEARQHELDAEPWRRKLVSPAAWSDAAGYTVADLTMLRREMLVGYLVAGFLAVVVPPSAWNAVFLHGHGAFTAVENAAVAPVIAFASFVCSIGNVPLAAALWKGGISFGGVVSFLFADLLAAPLVLIYRRAYGGALTLRLVGLFWVVMAGAGLVVGAVFSAAGLVPAQRPTRLVPTSFSWGPTTVLDIAFLAVLGCLYWLHRNRERLGGGAGYALDPVCGMQVRIADAPARARRDGRDYWFCSERCAERFGVAGARRRGATAAPAARHHGGPFP